MKTAEAVFANPAGRRLKDDLFTISIKKIVSDILLKEIKGTCELKTIAIISPFRKDGKSKISEQLSRMFSCQGSKTLLIHLQSIQFMGNYIIDPLRSGKLVEECIIRADKRGYDTLSMDEIGKTCGFTFDKASFANLLRQLGSKYKRIIIDTEPLNEDMSGFLAACVSDGAYFICNSETVRDRQPEQYYRKLKEIGANVLGIIYNNVKWKALKKIHYRHMEKTG